MEDGIRFASLMYLKMKQSRTLYSINKLVNELISATQQMAGVEVIREEV